MGFLTFFVIAGVGILYGFLAVKIVPQSEKYVIERLGKLHTVLGPGVNFIVPLLDSVRWKGPILERQLAPHTQDAVTSDNVILKVETVVFYRILEPEKSVYRISNVADAIKATITGAVRSEIGKIDLDRVQANRSELNEHIRTSLTEVLESWGIEVTRTEILDVELDARTQDAMLKQLNAERERRAAVMQAEGEKRATELRADGDLYAAEQHAKARRLEADAEAYATKAVAEAINKNGIGAAQYHVALKQVDALVELGKGQSRQIVLLPTTLTEAFGDAFKMLQGGPVKK
jgi:regulator of protease activity HflC (stomatin/prohibitin superfamily)